MIKKSILVTGSSSGLGRAIALCLKENGFYVFAGIRKVQGLFGNDANIEEIKLDVTDERSIDDAFQKIKSRLIDYPLWGLVNNAGICVPSPIELLSAEDLRRQLNTNVIGQLSVTQVVLPMIRANQGRIVNVTSGLGSVAVPYLGAYSIAQFAKMAFTDVLRRELKNSGVSIAVVQPGAVYTPIWNKLIVEGKTIIEQSDNPAQKIYRRSFDDFLDTIGVQARLSQTTEYDFAKVILEVLTAKTPESHYYVGEDARQLIEKARTLSSAEIDELFDNQIPTQNDFSFDSFGIDRSAS
jgi:NAD(P)-dependent dehydrogenase (short-subunit alcohol dehydrogenase family)